MGGEPQTAAEVAAAIRSGTTTAQAVVEASLGRIESRDGELGAFLTVDAPGAREAAAAFDRRHGSGKKAGLLAGVPVAVKDNLCTRGLRTTCASRMLETHVPLYDATAVRRLREAGAIMVGKTNLDEFAMGSSTEYSAFQVTRNPWNRNRVAGGSSGGSAVAVAAGMVPVALGTDTGGSVRQPAAFCGVYGLKPTYGRVSRFGLVAFASSFDQVGGFARSVEDLIRLYATVAGPDERDATSEAAPVETGTVGDGVANLRLGIAGGIFEEGVQGEVDERVRAAAAALGGEGARVSSVELPDSEAMVSAYYLVADAEASSNLARYDGVRYGLRVERDTLEQTLSDTRGKGFGPEVKRRILLGTYVLSAGYADRYYRKALAARAIVRRRMDALFRTVDLVILPTTPTTAFRLGERTTRPLSMYLSDRFTVLANLAGLPALSVPMGLDANGLPVGVQLVAPRWREDWLFRAASILEKSWPALHPPFPFRNEREKPSSGPDGARNE